MPVLLRWPLLIALTSGALSACTETRTVEPQPAPESGTRRIRLDLGLAPLPDGGERDATEPDATEPDADDPDASAADAADLDPPADSGDGDLTDLSLVDATPANGQNGDE